MESPEILPKVSKRTRYLFILTDGPRWALIRPYKATQKSLWNLPNTTLFPLELVNSLHKIKFQNAQGLLDSMTYGSSKGWICMKPLELTCKNGVFGVQGCLLIYKVSPDKLENTVLSTKNVLDLLVRIVKPEMVGRLHTLKLFEVPTELAKISTSKVAPEVLHAMRSQSLETHDDLNPDDE